MLLWHIECEWWNLIGCSTCTRRKILHFMVQSSFWSKFCLFDNSSKFKRWMKCDREIYHTNEGSFLQTLVTYYIPNGTVYLGKSQVFYMWASIILQVISAYMLSYGYQEHYTDALMCMMCSVHIWLIIFFLL